MTPDLDALSALLATATRFPHEDDGYGGCVSCVWMIPNTEDEYERVWYPCPASFLPSLIEAARREAGLREALTAVSRKLWADADAIEDSQTGTQKARSIAAEALRAAAVEVDRALLHDSAGTATGDEVGEP